MFPLQTLTKFFLIFLTSVSGLSNLTLTDVLTCDSSPHAPPDLSSVWISNATDTCLYVTIEDKFGDGWGNNTNLFYWAQAGNRESNIVSVGLACTEDCGDIKTGCLRPLDLADEDEHFIHFTLVLVDEDNQLSVPEHFWEMQWSVQVVKGGEWGNKYYGGFNSSMVFNYNQDADELSLAWSENLWQYPPPPAVCGATSSPAQFFALVAGGLGPNQRTHSSGFTANDTYFEPFYSVVALPHQSLEQFGWVSCLPDDLPLSKLYLGHFTYRTSAAGIGAARNAAAWSLCGHAGHGAQQLDFAMSESDTCWGQRFGSVADLCAGALVPYPSSAPSLAPTIRDAATFFHSFDSATLVKNAPAYQSISTANRVIFSYNINYAADFSAAEAAWKKFVATYVVSTFDVQYYSFSVWASYLKMGAPAPVQWSKTCVSASLSDSLIAAVSSGNSAAVASTSCDRVSYKASSNRFCLGCATSAAFSSQCSTVESGVVSLPTKASCYSGGAPLSKHAVVVEIFLREAVPASVPTLLALGVTPARQALSVTANITTSSAGGKLYCLATEVTAAATATPSRTAIKSRGVAVSVPPAAGGAATQHISRTVQLGNLYASTAYVVHCFTEDSRGNQMAAEDIETLRKAASTLCCQELVFQTAPSTVQYGASSSSDGAVAPTVFKFSLPRLPATSLLVTPTFYSQTTNLQITSITAAKSSFLFDSTTRSRGVSRSFAVTATQSGAFYVKLALSGDAAAVAKYSSSSALFETRLVGGVLPAPALGEARFSDAGGSVSLAFAESTDFGLGAVTYDHTGFWACSLFFNFVGSEHTACSWKSDAAVLLSFCGEGVCASVPDRNVLALLVPGDDVTLKAGLVRAKCQSSSAVACRLNTPAAALLVTVSAPLRPLLPVVFLAASSPGGSCDSNLVVDATASSGAGGRAWASWSWTVTVADAGAVGMTSDVLASAAAVQASLTAAGDLHLPAEVAFSLLRPVRYSVALRVTNFLGASSFSSTFVDMISSATEASKPSIAIDGSSYRKIRSFEALDVSVSVVPPPCVSSNRTKVEWSVYRDITFLGNMKSLSADPKVMKLDPYQLSAGSSYRIQVKVTLETGASAQTMVRVDVAEGSVYVKIRGGDKVALPLRGAYTLDASDSVIEDVSPLAAHDAWAPLLSWSCSVASTATTGLSYGEDCSNILNAAVSAPLSSTVLVPLRTEIMLPGGLYRVTASTYSASGAYVSASVDIQVGAVSAEQASAVAITSAFKKFNADRILQLSGTVAAPTAPARISANVTMWWAVLDSYGAPLSLGDSEGAFLTPLRRVRSLQSLVSSAGALTSLSFSAAAGTFSPGIEYAFRLSAEVGGAVTYASVTLVANAPPSSGKLEVLPSSGVSMTTSFSWSSLYWTDDLEDFPLLYTFKYALAQPSSGSGPFSVVGLSSQRAFLSTMLPAGSRSAGSAVICAVSVADFYEASAVAMTEVVVEEGLGASIEVSFSNFSASITLAVARLDWNRVAQDVSNAATLISLTDCQYAPDCASLQRAACSTTTPPHTCGSCAAGLEGLAGPSNTACFGSRRRLASGQADVGSACSVNADCRYDSCVQNTCAYPAKSCPSANSQECSGRGGCTFYNDATARRLLSSSGEFATCFANDISCSARCVCSTGYGKACSLSADQHWNRSMTRELVCESLQTLSRHQDQSTQLAVLLASSAAAAYDPSEVVSPAGISKCLAVLHSLSNISYSGHFRNEGLGRSNSSTVQSISLQENFAELISAFLDTLALLNSTSHALEGVAAEEEWLALSEQVEAGVSGAVTALSRAISAKMAPGQSSLEVVTAGVRMKISYDSFEDLHGALLSPPLTAEEQQYGSPVSAIVLPASGLSSCSSDSAAQDQDQYARLSVMQWGGNPYSAMNSSVDTAAATSNASAPLSASALLSRVLRFTPMAAAAAETGAAPVHTDPYTLVLQYATEQNWTVTKPACGSFQDGETTACPCNVTSYDSLSVTLECYNLLDFCPPAAPSSSRMLQGTHGGDTRHPHYGLAVLQEQRRRLDFDYGGDADDDTAPTGGLMNYGVMFTNLQQELTSTLSGNPFTSIRSLDDAKPVLVMMSMLVFIAVTGYVLCAKWDRYDRVYLKYVMLTTPDKRYKAPTVLSLQNAFMEKTFVSQKRKAALTFQDLGSKMRNEKAKTTTEGAARRQLDHASDMFFEDIYTPHEQDRDQDEEDREGNSCVPTLATIKDYVQDAHHTADAAHEAARLDKMGHKIATFFDTALPPTSLLERSNGWTRFVRAVLREHDWFRIFSYSSLRLPRTIRFLIVCTDVLILLFVDSLFYGVLFPDDGSCTVLDNTSEEQCMLAPSKFSSGSSMCYWDDETSLCALRPPPTSLLFYMVVAIVVTTISIGPQAICHVVLEEICALEPVFFKHIARKHDSATDHMLSDDASGYSATDEDVELAPDVLEEKWASAKEEYLFHDGFDTKKLYERYAYFDYTTAEEETSMLLRFISNSLEQRLKSAPIPWRRDKVLTSGLSAANMDAIMRQLGIYADGSPVELSWAKRVLCGVSPRDRVVSKIRRVRKGVDLIMDHIDAFPADMEEHQETTLMQHFILEQLTPFKRYALHRQFFQFDCAAPDKISGLKYSLGWAFIGLVWLFCVYWIFMWAITNSGPTMSSWSYAIGFVIVQDVLVNEMVQVTVVHVIAIEALRPQLKRIYTVLNQILSEKISTRSGASQPTQEEREDSWEFCVAQHMSAACRAARRPELHYIPFSQLLMRITDYDVMQCRDERGIQLSGFVVALLAVPTFLALSHEVVQDMFLDVILPTAWSCFCIANAYALMLGPWVLVAVYSLVLLALVYRQVVVVPRLRKRNLLRAMDVEGYKYDTKEELMWQNMNLQLELVHLNTLNQSAATSNPLRVQHSTHRAPFSSSASTSFARPLASRLADDCHDDEASVMSELTAPATSRKSPPLAPMSSGRRRGGSVGGCVHEECSMGDEGGGPGARRKSKYEEESMAGDHEDSLLGEVQLPPEIMGMHNNTAREQFIHMPVKSKDRSVLGISTINKLLGLAKPTKLKKSHVADTQLPRPLPPAHRSSISQHPEVEMEVEMNEEVEAEVEQEEAVASTVNTRDSKNVARECDASRSSSDAGSAGPLNPLVDDDARRSRRSGSTSKGSSRRSKSRGKSGSQTRGAAAGLRIDTSSQQQQQQQQGLAGGEPAQERRRKKRSPRKRGLELVRKLSDKLSPAGAGGRYEQLGAPHQSQSAASSAYSREASY